MNDILYTIITSFTVLSLVLGFLYAIVKLIKNKYAESARSNSSIKGWKTRKQRAPQVVYKTVKTIVREIPININGKHYDRMVVREAV